MTILEYLYNTVTRARELTLRLQQVSHFLFETFCRYVNDLGKYHMEDCMHHVLGLGAMKLSFRTKAENLFILSNSIITFLQMA